MGSDKSFKSILSFWLEQRNWSVYKLAKESELSCSTINNILSRGTEPTYTIMKKLAKGLGVSVATMLNETSGDVIPLSKEEREILHLFNSLSKKDKLIAKAYLEGINHISKEVECCE